MIIILLYCLYGTGITSYVSLFVGCITLEHSGRLDEELANAPRKRESMSAVLPTHHDKDLSPIILFPCNVYVLRARLPCHVSDLSDKHNIRHVAHL